MRWFFLALLVFAISESCRHWPTGNNVEGFTPGWTLGTRFEGSYGADGSVYDLGSALGYNFSRHFGVDAGVPLNFVGTPSSIKKNNPGAVSGIGVGIWLPC